MLGRFLESANPTTPVIVECDYNDISSGNIIGVKNDYVGLYPNSLNTIATSSTSSSIQLSDFLFPNGPRGILHQDVEYLMLRYGDRNVYINTDTPSRLYDTYHPEKLHIDIDTFNEDYLRLASGIHHEHYRPYLSKYLQTMVPLQLRPQLQPYHSSNTFSVDEFHNLFPDVMEVDIKPVRFDKELLRALKNPEKYIDYLKKTLVLDKNTGYYCYNKVPYICQHVFMSYAHESIKTIVNTCGDADYCCKFCGAELAYIDNTDEVNLSDIQYSIVDTFLDTLCIMEALDGEIRLLVQTGISQAIKQLNLDDTMESVSKADGFTAAYLLTLTDMLKKSGIKIVKESDLKSKFNSVFQKSGWDDETIKAVMKVKSRFINIEHIHNVIKAFKDQVTTSTDNHNDIVHILLDGIKGNGNPIQELYLTDKEKLGDLYTITNLNANNYTQITGYNSITDTVNHAFDKEITELYVKSGMSIQSFFNIWWKFICPVKDKHKFNSSNTCEYCGINESNVKDI